MTISRTIHDFDTQVYRRDTNSTKWLSNGQGPISNEDNLPMWVADMDFKSPQPVIDALHERIEHGIFGYTMTPDKLSEVVCARLKRLYNWDVQPEDLVFSPGLVFGLGVVARSIGNPGEGILIQTPVYGPFLSVPQRTQRFVTMEDLTYVQDDDSTFHYEIDFEAFEKAASHPQITMFIMCNPHNPGGHMFRRDELEKIAEICQHHNVVICSDEIHAELILDDRQHIPIASISPESAANTITLIAPSKTFNLAGLVTSVIIVQNKELREKIKQEIYNIGTHVNLLGYIAAEAAYAHGDEWLQELRGYLRENREIVVDYVRNYMPGVKMMIPEGTYLAWMDCRELATDENPRDFFLNHANVTVNDGTFFGEVGRNFIRLNFACPRSMLIEALERMKEAIAQLA